jgi:hypothetical protein
MTPDCRDPDRGSTMDTLLDTLNHSVRRELIRQFETREGEGVISVRELAAAIAHEHPSKTESDLRVQLVHVHLPKLADRGWVEYDADAGRVRYSGHETGTQLLEELQELF